MTAVSPEAYADADMALFHRATVTPTKAELIAEWAPTQPWGPRPMYRSR